MKFLELPNINAFNNFFGNLTTPDGSRLQIRLEVYTCKAAGNDKRLLKQLESKFNLPTSITAETSIKKNRNSSTPVTSFNEFEDLENTRAKSLDSSSISLFSNSNSPSPSPSQHIINLTSGLNVKTFYYLISTMNNMFPDYDFSQIPSEVFIRTTSLPTLINHFNTSIFNTGIDRNTTTFADFTRRMWNCMNEAVGSLEESEIYSFDSEAFEIDDPFRERGTIWSLNSFFYNRKLKRVLVFHARQVNNFSFEELGAIRSGSVTPTISSSN